MSRAPGPWLLSLSASLLALLLPAFPLRGQQAGARDKELARFDARVKAEDRRHWAFQPVRRPAVPQVKNVAWVRNPIDAFVLARLEGRGWTPAPPAEPRALLRRVYFDLIGLPPTPREQQAFLEARGPGAWEYQVEQLLASPHFGERWGRHWLDLVRYAETNGYERDADRPFVWRYRDYVIAALNEDKPFDRFILEQLAGDELPDGDDAALIATGYYRLGPWDDEPADPDEDRFDQLDDLVSTTGLAFLGLTVGCCRCHDHKLEPLTMHDYYRLVAVFRGLQRPTRERTELTLPIGPAAKVAALEQRDRKIEGLKTEGDRLRKGTVAAVRAALGGAPAGPLVATGLTAEGARQAAANGARLKAIERQIAALRKAVPDLPRGYFLHEPSPLPPQTNLLRRGKASRPGPAVRPGVPAVLVSRQPAFLPPGSRTSRRRLSLAQWIANPDNSLTARVIVNRVWQWHFGEGLVRTPSDFGTAGDRPSHPELLDWLADWFVCHGWSLRQLNRLILTSNTYRMSKQWQPDYGRQDPEDRLLWRFPYRRLEAELVRDAMLAVSGRLNQQMFGPWTYPEVPAEALAGSSDPGKIWQPFDEHQASRRTIYAHVKRSFLVPLLEVLDLCDTTRSSDRRLVTTVAPQALSLFNGSFANRQARYLAERLVREAGTDPVRQIKRAYLLALCRPPTQAERSAMLNFLRQESERGLPATEGEPPRALMQVCRVILNLNEFVYCD